MERREQRQYGDISAETVLSRGLRIGEEWSRVGFDWSDVQGPRNKVDEELRELDEAISTGASGDIEREMGDLVFAIVNLGRHLNIDVEVSLGQALDRVERRFSVVEGRLIAEGRRATECSIQELEAHWQSAKQELKRRGDD